MQSVAFSQVFLLVRILQAVPLWVNSREFEWFWVEGFQTKGEGLGLLIWFELLTMNGKQQFEFRTNWIWSWIIPKADKKVKFQVRLRNLILIYLSTFWNCAFALKNRPVKVWNFVRWVGHRFKIAGRLIWTLVDFIVNPRSLKVRINYNLILTFLIICL